MKRAVAQLFRLTIAKKLFLGFLSYGILTLLIAFIALSSLQRLNEINNRIIGRDVPLAKMTDKMIEALLAQELYGRRFFILRSSEMEALFWKRSEEFKKLLQQMGNLPEVSDLPLDRLSTLHEEYNQFFKTELEKQKEEKGLYWLYEKLKFLDSVAAEKIDPRNYRRTIRALEVIMTTGRKFSEQRGQSDSPYRLITVGLTRPRPELYERVDQRIEMMFANGFIQEAKNLLAKGYSPSLPTMSAIGYRECIRVINGELNEEQAKAEIRRATRIFVRRQANWFKESDPNIKWFRVEEGVVEEIESHILMSL